MEADLTDLYKGKIWEVYARAVSTITILTIVVTFVIGTYDIVRLAFPAFTLNSALHEKYQTNESYTDFGTFKKDIPEETITHERTANYDKLLRMERRDASQRLLKVALAMFIIVILNSVLLMTNRNNS